MEKLVELITRVDGAAKIDGCSGRNEFQRRGEGQAQERAVSVDFVHHEDTVILEC